MKGATLPHRVWVSPPESMGSPPGRPPVRQADGGVAGIAAGGHGRPGFAVVCWRVLVRLPGVVAGGESGQIGTVRIAPQPLFARFDRTDQRMAGLREVAASVFGRRAVAARNRAAGETHAEMHRPSALIPTGAALRRPRHSRDGNPVQVAAIPSPEGALEHRPADAVGGATHREPSWT